MSALAARAAGRPASGGRRPVVFYRHFQGLTGGHLKVWDYFNHVRSSPDYDPSVVFSPASIGPENPWTDCPERIVLRLPEGDQVWFVGGLDWLAFDRLAPSGPPVINLIQHLVHADPANARYQFLRRRAVRICVSEEVAAALRSTGRVNGPILTVPNGVALPDVPIPPRRDIDVVVVANKAPGFGARVAARLHQRGHRVRLVDTALPRPDFLALLARARVAAFAPNPIEGFYLPALEAMALRTAVVVPDCVGNRSFCRPAVNCLRPAFTADAVADDAEAALALPRPDFLALLGRAQETADGHSLAGERRRFLAILDHLDEWWAAAA